jgi:hypothetical protein
MFAGGARAALSISSSVRQHLIHKASHSAAYRHASAATSIHAGTYRSRER